MMWKMVDRYSRSVRRRLVPDVAAVQTTRAIVLVARLGVAHRQRAVPFPRACGTMVGVEIKLRVAAQGQPVHTADGDLPCQGGEVEELALTMRDALLRARAKTPVDRTLQHGIQLHLVTGV